MKEPVSDDQIRAYLKGRLDDPTRRQFEQLLQGDADWARNLALRRAEMAAAELLIAAETREWFKTWQQEPPAPHKPGKKSILAWIGGSALLMLLLFVAIRLLSPQPPPAEQPLPSPPLRMPHQPAVSATPPPVAGTTAAKPTRKQPIGKSYVTLAAQQMPDPIRATFRQTATDTALSLFRKAQLAFVAGDYPKTLALLAQTDPAQRQSAAFLAAHALFQLRRFPEAESQFAKLIDENSRQYKFQSEWGLLMCRLAGLPREKEAFRTQLDAILKQKDHPYFNRAKALKKQLYGS